jgi:hypothetical protein
LMDKTICELFSATIENKLLANNGNFHIDCV